MNIDSIKGQAVAAIGSHNSQQHSTVDQIDQARPSNMKVIDANTFVLSKPS
jgi:hypothetical protein